MRINLFNFIKKILKYISNGKFKGKPKFSEIIFTANEKWLLQSLSWDRCNSRKASHTIPIQIKKAFGYNNSPQTEKPPMQNWFSFKESEIIMSPLVAFTFGDHDHFKGADALLYARELWTDTNKENYDNINE